MNAIDQFTLLDTQQIIDKIGKIPIENFKYLRLDQIIDLIGKIEYKDYRTIVNSIGPTRYYKLWEMMTPGQKEYHMNAIKLPSISIEESLKTLHMTYWDFHKMNTNELHDVISTIETAMEHLEIDKPYVMNSPFSMREWNNILELIDLHEPSISQFIRDKVYCMCIKKDPNPDYLHLGPDQDILVNTRDEIENHEVFKKYNPHADIEETNRKLGLIE